MSGAPLLGSQIFRASRVFIFGFGSEHPRTQYRKQKAYSFDHVFPILVVDSEQLGAPISV